MAGLAMVLVGTFMSTPAQASNFTGATGGVGCSLNMADNLTHSVWYAALTPASSSAVSWTRTYNYDPTDLNTVGEDALDALTDVVFKDEDYEGPWACGPGSWRTTSTSTQGYIGFAQCMTLSASTCQQFDVYFDLDFMGPKTSAQENGLACHELGHTVGLTHTTDGKCMDPLPGVAQLTTHDTSHITINY